MVYGLIEILDKIYDYYKTTLEYTREASLGLGCVLIELDEDYPYYNEGLRCIEVIDGVMGDYYNNRFYMNVYCDLKLLNSEIYHFLSISSEVNDVFVVSNNSNILNDIDYRDDVYFMCDMSNIHMNKSYYKTLSLEFKQFKNFIESKVNLSLNHFYLNYDITNHDIECDIIDSIVKDLELINLPYETNGLHFTNNKSGSMSDACIIYNPASVNLYLHLSFNNNSCTYDMVLDYVDKLLFKMHKQKNLTLRLYLESEDRVFIVDKIKDINSCNCEILDYKDFNFIKKYLNKYKDIELNLKYY